MIWTTAGTNRVCSRCLALKDTVVGYTDELGVLLPPLHPRCRCAIMYDEVGTPRATRPKPTINPLLPASIATEIISPATPEPQPEHQLENVGFTRRTRPMTEKEAESARVDEETAFNTITDTDFGFKKMKRTPKWLDEILLTNMTDISSPNCQRCVVAHEARMRGYDVVARPSWGANDSLRGSGGWIKAFDFSYNNIQPCNGTTGDEVVKSAKEIMQSFGEGARAIIVFKLDKINGHAIVAECREKGIVNFGDPQWGERAVAYKLKLADIDEKVIIFRVDNLEFTNVVKRCCKNRE